MTMILSWKNYQMRLKENLNVLGKTHKTIETFLLQWKRKLQKLQRLL